MSNHSTSSSSTSSSTTSSNRIFIRNDDPPIDQAVILRNVHDSSISFDSSKISVQEPVNKFAKRIEPIYEQIQIFQRNFETNKQASQNECDCVKFCVDLLNEHIRSLDEYNACCIETETLIEKLDEANHRIKDLERSLWFEKESKNDLTKKYEDDELQNQQENVRTEKKINILSANLRKIESERKQIFEEKQDLLMQYQRDVAKWDKERQQLQILNKKLINEKEFNEIQSLNHRNMVTNMTHELSTLFNLALSYRRKSSYFGKLFMNAFDLVFGRFKSNATNVTFVEMTSRNASPDLGMTMLSCSNNTSMYFKDVTCDEFSNFNIILKEKLLQNENEIAMDNETYDGNSKFFMSTEFEDDFENRLFGNETFKLASLTECRPHIPTTIIEIIAKELLEELIADETKVLIIKTILDHNNETLHNPVCKDDMKFMYKSAERSQLEASFLEEIHNRFEESWPENLARNWTINRTGDKSERLAHILEDHQNKNDSQNICPKLELCSTRIITKSDETESSTLFTDDVNRKSQQSTADQQVSGLKSNEIPSSDNAILVTSQSFKHDSEIRTNQWLNSTTSLNSLSDCASNESTELVITLTKESSNQQSENFFNRSNSSSNYGTDESKRNSMQLTNLHNLSNVFNELSGNHKLNSTVLSDEQCSSHEIKLNSLETVSRKQMVNNLNSTMSSDMRLSDDEGVVDIDSIPNNDSTPDESDSNLETVMMSQDEPSFDLGNVYSTIKQDSDHNATNMDLSTISHRSNFSKDSLSDFRVANIKHNLESNDDTILSGSKSDSCSLHRSNSKCRFRQRKSTWSPYFSPIMSLIYLFYPFLIIFKYMFLAFVFFVLMAIYFLNHSPAIKIFYSSWYEIGFILLSPLAD